MQMWFKNIYINNSETVRLKKNLIQKGKQNGYLWIDRGLENGDLWGRRKDRGWQTNMGKDGKIKCQLWDVWGTMKS